MIFVFFLSAWLGIVSGCVRTADSGTGTTLPPSVTTTVPGATTTVPGATTTAAGTSCNSCQASQVVLGPDPNDGALSHSPDAPMAGPPLNGCSTLIITCTPMPPQQMSLMTFQNDLGGPAPGNPATATLVCNTMGVYQLQDFNGPAITEAHCLG